VHVTVSVIVAVAVSVIIDVPVVTVTVGGAEKVHTSFCWRLSMTCPLDGPRSSITSTISLANLWFGTVTHDSVSVTVTHLSTVFVAGGGVLVTVSVSVMVV
jgi:hypothetical protein